MSGWRRTLDWLFRGLSCVIRAWESRNLVTRCLWCEITLENFDLAVGTVAGISTKALHLEFRWNEQRTVARRRFVGDQTCEQMHLEHWILNKFCWTIGQLNKKLFNKCLIPQKCNWTNGKLPNFWLNRSQLNILNKLFNYGGARRALHNLQGVSGFMDILTPP